jgi:hypothetical protein
VQYRWGTAAATIAAATTLAAALAAAVAATVAPTALVPTFRRESRASGSQDDGRQEHEESATDSHRKDSFCGQLNLPQGRQLVQLPGMDRQ